MCNVQYNRVPLIVSNTILQISDIIKIVLKVFNMCTIHRDQLVVDHMINCQSRLVYESKYTLVYSGYMNGVKVGVKYNLSPDWNYDQTFQISSKAYLIVNTPKPLVHIEYCDEVRVDMRNYTNRGWQLIVRSATKSMIVFEWYVGEHILATDTTANKVDIINQP